MLPAGSISKEDLSFLEKTVEQSSLRLGCDLHCYLSCFKNTSLWEKRKNIREQMVQKVEEINILSPEQKEKLLTPGAAIQIPFVSLSLSHCISIGGFILSPFIQSSIGLDLEQRGRAKEKTVLRISDQEELNLSPSADALWSAKEAAYKSVHQFQGDISIRQLSIFHWESILSRKVKIYDYEFKVEKKAGRGCVCFLKNIIVAVAFITC